MIKTPVYKAKFAIILRCFLLICILTPGICIAQTRGTVKVFKDPLIDTLIAKRGTLDAGKSGSMQGFSSSGYRIQIFSGSNRRDAYNIQARFQSDYPGVRTYITYLSPNFKVHVGDFRTRIEAEKMVRDLKIGYGTVFIFATKINPPKAEIND